MPTVVANFQRDLGSIRVFLGSTLYQNRFWAQTRRKPAPLQPPTLARASQYLRGEGITRLYCAHTRGITHYACKVFFLDFWHFFVAFLYDFFCIHSTFADGVWLAFAAMRLIVRCPRRIVAPFFVAGGGGVRQPVADRPRHAHKVAKTRHKLLSCNYLHSDSISETSYNAHYV